MLPCQIVLHVTLLTEDEKDYHPSISHLLKLLRCAFPLQLYNTSTGNVDKAVKLRFCWIFVSLMGLSKRIFKLKPTATIMFLLDTWIVLRGSIGNTITPFLWCGPIYGNNQVVTCEPLNGRDDFFYYRLIFWLTELSFDLNRVSLSKMWCLEIACFAQTTALAPKITKYNDLKRSKLAFEELEPSHFWCFCLKINHRDCMLFWEVKCAILHQIQFW